MSLFSTVAPNSDCRLSKHFAATRYSALPVIACRSAITSFIAPYSPAM